MTKKKSLFNHPWIISTCTAVLAAWIADYYKVIDVLAALSISAKWLWNLVVGKVELSRFWLVVIFLTPIIMRWILKSRLEQKVQTLATARKEPEFLKYRQDIFEGVLYKWEYMMVSGKYSIYNIAPYCPDDNCLIIQEQSFTPLYCPICRRQFDLISELQLQARIRHSASKKFGIES